MAVVTIIIGLLALSVLVFAHELGHFITAKASRVKVEEFGIGYPPRLLSIRRGETLYSLNAVPFGGFTKMAGEEDPGVERSLASKGRGTRLLVLSAGAIMNLLLPVLLLSIALMVPHNVVSGQVTIVEVLPNSPAASAGIAAGDTLLTINGKAIRNIGDLHRHAQSNLGNEISVTIGRSDQSIEEFRLIPRWKPPEGQGAIGIYTKTLNPTFTRESLPFWRAIPAGAVDSIEMFVLYKNGIISLIIGAIPVQMAGPVGIVQVTGEVARAGISPLLEIIAVISMAIGITQLIPLPALDGGRIAFVLLEWVRRGKRISPKREGLVHLVGFVVLMGFMLAITYQDIIRIISGESLIP
ncbi:MAG: M50 family metallopeptidase [Chloroflexota bacterium]